MRKHIEETGKAFEKFALNPMQGRIMAYLINSEKPEVTFMEMVRYFGASKSSISTALNHLLSTGMIDYTRHLTDRKKYFFITEDFFRLYFEQLLKNINDLKGLCYKTISTRSDKDKFLNEKVHRWLNGSSVFEESISHLLVQNNALKKKSFIKLFHKNSPVYSQKQ